MKAIMMSIRPEWVAKILNGEKTLEIRKTMPKCDLPIDVYIYCTKEEKQVVFGKKQNVYLCDRRGKTESGFDFMTLTRNEDTESFINDNLNGKVVAKFTLNKVEEIKGMFDELNREYAFENEKDLLDKSCLESDELGDYLKIYNNNDYEKVGYAWHIDNLVPFDKPKELREFWNNGKKVKGHKGTYQYSKLTSAPQSFMFIEV